MSVNSNYVPHIFRLRVPAELKTFFFQGTYLSLSEKPRKKFPEYRSGRQQSSEEKEQPVPQSCDQRQALGHAELGQGGPVLAEPFSRSGYFTAVGSYSSLPDSGKTRDLTHSLIYHISPSSVLGHVLHKHTIF